MATLAKNSRIDFRLTEAQKRTIETAADILGRTTTDFSLDVLLQRSQEVINSQRQLELEASAFDVFINVMNEEPKTVEGLRELMQRKSVFDA